ncbi:MAG: helix-turn-helix domain-containing protein [Terriglobales bacterium]
MIDLSTRGAAQKMDISLNATYSALWSGRLRAEKRDGRWLISAEAVDEYLQRRRSREIANNTPAKSQRSDFKSMAAGDRE